MKKTARFTVITAIICIAVTAGLIHAQDNRRVRPSFPIAAGEKMLVIPGVVFDRTEANATVTYVSEDNMDVFFYHIPLPVGTTLKRIVVDAADNDGNSVTQYMVFDLVRRQNGAANAVFLRRVETQGYNSSAFNQFISNPINHQMLQGWTYYINYSVYGGTSTEHKLSVIKIIYEP